MLDRRGRLVHAGGVIKNSGLLGRLRGENGHALALLGVFVALHSLFMLLSQVELYHPEEYLNLRLFRQLAADLPLGGLGDYAYGAGTGLDGGGTVVHSLLYVPLAAVLGPGQLAIKTMALLWATAGAALCVLLGRRLFGDGGGRAAALAVLALPPAYLVFSSISWANHMEGSVLVLALLWVFAWTADRADTATPRGRAVALGALAAFVPWYSPLALVPVGLLALSAPWVFRRRLVGMLPWLAVGVAVGLVPALAVDLPVVGAEESGTLGMALAGDRDWGLILTSLIRVETYDVWWPGRWNMPGAVVTSGHIACLLAAWSGVAMLLAWAVNPRIGPGGSWRTRGNGAVAAVAALTALVLPVLLAFAGGWAARRLSPVFLPWALGWALGLCWLRARWDERPRTVAAVTAVVVIAAASPGLLLTASGALPRPPVELHRVALMPQEQPRAEATVGMTDFTAGHLDSLDHLLADPRTEAPVGRMQAINGLDGAVGGPRLPLRLEPARCQDRGTIQANGTLRSEYVTELTWEYVGRGLALGCPPSHVKARCELALEPAHRQACLAAAGL